MPRDFQGYIETQKKIHAAISADTSKVYESGLKFDPRVSAGYRGLVIVLKYPERFAQKVVDLSLAIKDHTGVLLRAHADTVHTTLAEWPRPYEEVKPERGAVDAVSVWLENWVHTNGRLTADSFAIQFGDLLWNESCVILSGHPIHREYLLLGDDPGLSSSFKRGWGSHITVARFEEPAQGDVVMRVGEEIKKWNLAERVLPKSIEFVSFTYHPKAGELVAQTHYVHAF